MYTSKDLGAWFKNGRKPGFYGGCWIDSRGKVKRLTPALLLSESNKNPEFYNSEEEIFSKKSSNSWSFI